MVNNSININKMNNYLLPQLIEHKKKTMIYYIGNSRTGLGQTQNCGRVKPVIWIPTFPSW